jgi:hypothetical protein
VRVDALYAPRGDDELWDLDEEALRRFTHAITRCAPVLADFERAAVREMREAELEYEWVADLVDDQTDECAISTRVPEFHAFLDDGDRRALLRQPGGDSRLRAVVRAEIKRRRGARE